jgi:Rod binding domain-containing protein
MVLLIKIVKQVRTVVTKAEDTIDRVESIAESFAKVSGPVGVAKVVVEQLKKHMSKEKEKEEE